jgi:hypothetical protein
MRSRVFILALLVFSSSLFAEQKVAPGNVHERMIVVVPWTGKGSFDDPIRPLFAPVKPDPNGILSYSYEPSDDKRYAIVEFVALDRKAFASILTDKRVVQAFVKGRDKPEDVEREVKKHKADFSIGKDRIGKNEGGGK